MDIIKIQSKLMRIKNKIAILSGKGGVGKTTFSINIANMFSKNYKVGLFDADVDCPNINKFLGINEQFKVNNNEINPISYKNLEIVSVASLLEKEDEPIIWRGPMKTNAILQLLEMVNFKDLDYLFFDMPPGTGDAVITIMQIVKPKVIIITNPSPISLLDAKRTINMCKKLNIEILGIVENMTGEIFGEGNARKIAEENNIPYLGSIPLKKEITKIPYEEKEIKEIYSKLKEEIASSKGL